MATAAAAAARRARAIQRISAGAQRAAALFQIEIAPPAKSKDPEANTSALLEYAADVIAAVNATKATPEDMPQVMTLEATPKDVAIETMPAPKRKQAATI